MVLGNLESRLGLPSLRAAIELFGGQSGKQLNSILTHLENLSKDTATIAQATELLKLVQELDRQGTLARLNEMLKALPKGKAGAVMVADIRKLVESVAPDLKRLIELAETLLQEE